MTKGVKLKAWLKIKNYKQIDLFYFVCVGTSQDILQFYLSIMWVLGFKLKSLSLVVSTLIY